MDETYPVGVLARRLEEAVYSASGKTEVRVYSPFRESLDDQVRHGWRHLLSFPDLLDYRSLVLVQRVHQRPVRVQVVLHEVGREQGHPLAQ